jgi:transketolase
MSPPSSPHPLSSPPSPPSLARVSDPGTHWTVDNPARLAASIRLRAVRMVAPHGFGYLGQALSSAEQVAALFTVLTPGSDRLVCSPGHYVIGIFAAAAELGILPDEAAKRYGQDGSDIEAIGTERSPVADYVCGSLGQGLSAAVGFALSDRMRNKTRRTFAMISDGELEEGQVWEAAMFAGHHRLDRLTVLLDANNSQVDGPVDTITTIEPIAAKWAAFGWTARDIDGHDVTAVIEELRKAGTADQPTILINRTSTAHGLRCLPPDADGHFIKLPPELAAAAEAELTAELRELETR